MDAALWGDNAPRRRSSRALPANDGTVNVTPVLPWSSIQVGGTQTAELDRPSRQSSREGRAGSNPNAQISDPGDGPLQVVEEFTAADEVSGAIVSPFVLSASNPAVDITISVVAPKGVQFDAPDDGDNDSRSSRNSDWKPESARPSLQQTVSKSLASLSLSMGRAAQSIKMVAVGDDDKVKDMWDNYVDDECEHPATPRKATVRDSEGRVIHESDGKVHPLPLDRTLSGKPYDDLLHEKRVTRTLLWHHGQTLIFSIIVAAVCMPLVALMSMIKWHQDVPQEEINAALVNGIILAPVQPNHKAIQIMLLMQLVFPLAVYALLLYICIRRTWKLPLGLVAAVTITIVWTTIVCALFYKFDVAFWFYYIDLFVIVAAYVPCMIVVGWYIESDTEAPMRHRINDMLFVALLETLVAAATLIYCYFIMPVFFMIKSAWLQMFWLCVVHPLYFEITTGYVVRKALYRNSRLGRNHVVYFLAIVHSLVHSTALATSLQSSIEPVNILAITITLYCVAKLIWRSTVIPRDLLIEKLLHGWSFKFTVEERAELARMVSVSVLTEIVLENASVIITPFMMFRMFNEPLFMAVVPNTFFNDGGQYPVATVCTVIALLLVFTIFFDIVFLISNYHNNQRLPLINTWRRIKKAQGWYMLFLVYAFACMGVLFLFLTMLILPRAVYCKTNNYCDCTTLAYQTVCEGGFVSLTADYLVGPHGDV